MAGRSCAAFLTRPFAKMHGDGGGAMPRQEAQELDCLSVEPAASLGAEDDKAASSGAAEFGISSVTLAPGSSESAAQPGRVFARGWVSTRRVRGEHDCCVKGELGAVPQGETVGDDLDAPFISDGHVEVSCLPDIAGDPGVAFAANARRHARGAARVDSTPDVAHAAR